MARYLSGDSDSYPLMLHIRLPLPHSSTSHDIYNVDSHNSIEWLRRLCSTRWLHGAPCRLIFASRQLDRFPPYTYLSTAGLSDQCTVHVRMHPPRTQPADDDGSDDDDDDSNGDGGVDTNPADAPQQNVRQKSSQSSPASEPDFRQAFDDVQHDANQCSCILESGREAVVLARTASTVTAAADAHRGGGGAMVLGASQEGAAHRHRSLPKVVWGISLISAKRGATYPVASGACLSCLTHQVV
jgi:hypothetical protein